MCLAQEYAHHTKLTPYTIRGLSVPMQYYQQLHCAALSTTSGWSIPEELKAAQALGSRDDQVMLLAFTNCCDFSAGAASFDPFAEIATIPVKEQVINQYLEFSRELPAKLEITSELKIPSYTVFPQRPWKVVQHATINTATFVLTPTYADIFWNEGDSPKRHEGTFVPRDHLPWPQRAHH